MKTSHETAPNQPGGVRRTIDFWLETKITNYGKLPAHQVIELGCKELQNDGFIYPPLFRFEAHFAECEKHDTHKAGSGMVLPGQTETGKFYFSIPEEAWEKVAAIGPRRVVTLFAALRVWYSFGGKTYWTERHFSFQALGMVVPNMLRGIPAEVRYLAPPELAILDSAGNTGQLQ
jgi:hypothetical protein